MGKTKLPKDFELNELLEKLAFAQEENQHAALEQPMLYMACVEYRTKQMRHRQEAEMKVDNMRVDLSVKFRKQPARMKGEKALTERALGDMVDLVPQYRDAIAELMRAKRKEEYAKLLLDAYEHRRSTIKILAQYAFIQDVFSGENMVESLNKKRRELAKGIVGRREDSDQ